MASTRAALATSPRRTLRSMRRTAPWAGLEQALREAGIDPAEFEQHLVDALAAARRLPGRDGDASSFTAAEAEVLDGGGLDLAPRRRGEPDVISRTVAAHAALLATALTVEQAAVALGVTRARIRQRALERSLYAIRERDEWRLPRWQFGDDGRPLRGLGPVIAALPRDLHPVAAWRFVAEPSPDLAVDERPVSPLEWLRSGGDPEPVVAVAREL